MKAWHRILASLVAASSFACSAAVQDLGNDDPTDAAGGGPVQENGDASSPDSSPAVDSGTGPDANDAGGGDADSSAQTDAGSSGRVVLFGGDDGSNPMNDAWSFDGSGWSQINVPNPPSARAYASMASLGGQLVLFGGGTGAYESVVVNDTWAFSGTSFGQIQGTNGSLPSPRDYTVAGTAGGRIVLFGGRADVGGLDNTVGDTWTFDGKNWTQVAAQSAPSARYLASMATLGDKAVLFGGAADSGPTNDTWTFDGTKWQQVAVSNPPPARYGAAMAALGNRVVLFGGRLPGATVYNFNDTWIFDGAAWSQVTVPNPPPARAAAAMGSRGNQVVLFGGSPDVVAISPFTDTWTFDGSSWTLVTGLNPPSGRNGACMVSAP